MTLASGRARKENFPVHSNFNHIVGSFAPPPCADPVELHIKIHIYHAPLSIRIAELEANSLQDVWLGGAQLAQRAHDHYLHDANGMTEAACLESKADYAQEIKPSLQQRMGISGTMGQFSQAMSNFQLQPFETPLLSPFSLKEGPSSRGHMQF
ncbi:hypothetical protein EDD18DRAFT_1112252 [Armillaria luteobubalina]|uniref:Uncharacterized protein n=1 Tax=Armillaria luteobubalina TaxID=153913 RepID=A0AA39PFH1_9AGAR|nr:hypothetical protein EDD18DRAFT_1112252 [Armillaria luteobubalina]